MTVHGYIGLGMMGSAMCERLARSGAAVLAHDLNPAAVDVAVERGAERVHLERSGSHLTSQRPRGLAAAFELAAGPFSH